MGSSDGFIPHYECTVMSGDCFYFSKCLSACKATNRPSHEARIQELERMIAKLRNQPRTPDTGDGHE